MLHPLRLLNAFVAFTLNLFRPVPNFPPARTISPVRVTAIESRCEKGLGITKAFDALSLIRVSVETEAFVRFDDDLTILDVDNEPHAGLPLVRDR